MTPKPSLHPSALLVVAIACISCFGTAHSAPPDLTAGGVPSNSVTINLGPTGMRGWVYHVTGGSFKASDESRQIQVQVVDAGSPADGIMAANDVILGVSGDGSQPVNFTSDARKSLASAINDAEARTPAELKLLRWRNGVTTTVTITLRTMGNYSATAPYNCPKSAQILEEGLQYITTSETAGVYNFGVLGLLAGNNPANPNNAARMARAQTDARAAIPTPAIMAEMMSDKSDVGASGWQRGHTLIMLAEYYLLTGDTQVIPAIRAYAVNIAKNQSLFGTLGHSYADPWPDGRLNGPMGRFYGVVNSAGLPCFLGVLLAKECGITDAEIDPAIERMSRFFAYYANKGAIPYGEHPAGTYSHESNGKCGLAALTFALQPSRSMEARFFSKMASAAAKEREVGHNGAFFNYLWSPLGAALGGEQAAAAHFSQIRWLLDLNRKWNGAFDYDNLNGEGALYSNRSYYDFRMSTAALLVYGLPLRQLHITGRSANPAHLLNSQELADALAADGYDASTRSVSELVSDLGNWSPIVQEKAANQIATRTLDSATINQIITLATDPNGTSRTGACLALGKINDPATTTVRASILASLLADPQNHVRYMAAQGMRSFDATHKMLHLNTILSAAASTAKPLFPMDEEDPLHMAHAQFGPLLFDGSSGVIPGSNVALAPKNLLYPAIRAMAANPVSTGRSSLASIYPHLTEADFRAVAGPVVDAARERTPADRMFSRSGRIEGVKMMQRLNKVAEGVPVALAVMKDDYNANDALLDVLKLYAGGANTINPDPDVDGFCMELINQIQNVTDAQQVLAAIAADPNPVPLTPLKGIQSVTADNPAVTLPAKLTTLRTTSNDYAEGASVYTWRKIRGAGNVTFTPNGTLDSKNTAVIFDGTPGQYLFEVKMSDSRGLTEVTSTVAVTLYQSGGTLPPNSPPLADNQTPGISQATATPVVLTSSDPEGYALNYRVTSQPTHGKLTGTAPYLVYTSDFSYTGPDSFTFEAMDSEGQVSTATVSITVTANNIFPTAIYEPFDYPAGLLNGGSTSSSVGFTGNWSGQFTVAAGSLAYGNLPTLGNSLISGRGSRVIATSALAANGLLNDGSTLWFSAVMGYGPNANSINAHQAFALANSNFYNANNQYYIDNEGSQLGSGLGVSLNWFGDFYGGHFRTTHFRDSSFGTTGTSGNVFGELSTNKLAFNAYKLVVGKFTWGATSDKIEIFEPDANLNLGPARSSLTVNVDQSTFDTITRATGDSVTIDEIRFGPNYPSVLNGNAPMIADTSAPLPGTMAFRQTPNATSPGSISMESVTAYDPNGVEYHFTCTAGGGHDSGWQDSPSYTDTGLTAGVAYSYTVKARDKSPARNETTPSSVASATIHTQTTLPNLVGMQQTSAESVIETIGMTVGTVAPVYDSGQPVGTVLGQTPAGDQIQPLGTVVDLTVAGVDEIAPTPSPATFTVAPVASNSSTITMTATTGIDPSGVEYLFTETSGNPGGSSSTWQDSPVFIDSGLTAATPYTYTVTLRDKSPAGNQTAASAPASATTNSIPAAQTWYWDGGTSDILANGNGASAGGTGTWNTTLLNWDAGNTAHADWNNAANKTAVFGGTAGTVTIGGGGVTVSDLQLTSANYTIKGDPLTVNGTSNLQINVAATIQSVLVGNFGLTKSGTGTLTLSAANTYTGNTTVTGGTLAAGSQLFLPVNSNVTVGSGSTLSYSASGNYNPLNVALNGGTLTQTVEHSTLPGTFTLGTGTTSTLLVGGRNNNLSGNFTGTGNLIVNVPGGNAIHLSGTNDYTGTTNITGNGYAIFNKPSALYNGNAADWTPAKITVNSGSVIGFRGGDGTNGFSSAQISTILGNLSSANNNGLRAGSSIVFDCNASALNHSGVISDSTGPGGGSVGVIAYGAAGGGLTLSGANTFTGKVGFRSLFASQDAVLRVSSLNSVSTNPALGTVHSASSSLGAPTTVANGTINIGSNGAQANTTLIYTGTGETTDRIIAIEGNSVSNATINQSGSGLLKFTSPFTANNTITPINLRGVGNGEVAGIGANGNLTKHDSGTWTIAGANACVGLTSVNGGALVLAHASALPGGIGATGGLRALTFNGGVIGLGAGDFSRPLAAAGTIGAVNFTGAGGWAAYGVDRAVNLGGASASIIWATANTGLNAKTLILGNPTATHTLDFQNPLDLGNATRTVQVDNGTAAIDGKLSGVLSGAGGALTKTGTGTLVLTNANSYTGVTSVSAGTLLIDGTTSTGAVIVASGATLGGKGTLGGDLTVAANGILSFDLSTPAASHDGLQVTTGKKLIFSGASSLNITSSGGASPGVYTLISGGNNIVGTPPTTVNMPNGWQATVSIVGNELRLNVSSAVNDAPTWTGNPVSGANAAEDSGYVGTLIGSATDADGDALTFVKVSGPAWLSVAADGALSGTPDNSNVGLNSFSVSVSDGFNPAVATTVEITVINSNDAPVWSGNPVAEATISEDSLFSGMLAGYASDADAGATLAFAKLSGPAWLNIAADGSVTGIPSNSDVGPNSFTVGVSDGIAPPVETTLNIMVINTNDAPVWAGNPVAGPDATEESIYSGTLVGFATDVDAGANLTFAKGSGPAWLSVAANGTMSGTPANSDVGANSFTVSVSDGIAAPVEAILNFTVINTNDAPTWAANPITGTDATEDVAYSGSIVASDVDTGATLTFAKGSGPAWLSIAANGTLSGTPANSDVGANSFTVSVSDGMGAPVEATLHITVINTNDSPAWTANPINAANATEDAAYSGTLAGGATDMDAAATLTYAKVSGPAWLSVAANGTLSGTPANSDVGANSFIVSASDGIATAVESTLDITVLNINDAPVWTGNPVIGTDATEDNPYIATLASEAADVDVGAIMTFAKVSGPAWLAIASDGSFTGTPANGDVGTNSFTVSVSDGIASAVETTFIITVINTNDAPVWANNPITGTGATEEVAYVATLAGDASDMDAGAIMTFAKVSGPAWLSIAPDGSLTGTPSNGDIGNNEFTVSVSDGIAAAVESTLNIAVENTNDAPFWASNPINGATATEDAAYTGNLATSVSDVDPGSTLTFTKVSGPVWLSLAANGALSGTPANNDVGVSTFIVDVSDGIAAPLETTLSITVVNTNDAPVFTTTTIVLAGASENVPYIGQTIAGQATDADAGDTITYSKVSGPAWLAVAANGALSGTPPSSTAGLNSFVVRATDSASATADATLQITVTVLPLPWTSVDVGTGMLAGSATFNSGTFTQAGSGVIGSTADKLRFTYQTLTGDGEIIARISALQNTGTSSRVGVMIRDSLAANSKQIFMGMTGSNAYRWTRRTATGGTTTNTSSSTGTVPNTWVRIVRSGTTITAYKSTNGTSWTTVGSTTNTTFSSTCFIGLVVGSGSNTTLNTSQFGSVSVTP